MISYPVNLLLENRLCLVVGGGRVARRKIERLLLSGARVRVVAPQVVAAIAAYAGQGRLELSLRPFVDDDLREVFLCFAATSDAVLNRRLLELARTRRILACGVDENWPQGDFITPAGCGAPGLQLAVSTEGVACRRAREIRNYLRPQLEMLSLGPVLTVYVLELDAGGDRGTDPELEARLERQLRLVWGVREFSCGRVANSLQLVVLAVDGSGVAELLETLLRAAGNFSGALFAQKDAAAFACLRKMGLASVPRTVVAEPRTAESAEAAGVWGPGLRQLEQLLLNVEGGVLAESEAWKGYEAFCRKL
ncbi:MAG TPA: bifunctional precorrin-2 dehydrogenase/sirohydrochlorin ferrochelatase [Proteobacteria bacterium]|nr:bifunctional precorrin-2 dehydrogenase/sirohydrochlorin ferrochelatase [Pseudomonadota bacterium]